MEQLLLPWFLAAAVMSIFIAVVGVFIIKDNGDNYPLHILIFGVLVDNRKKISLSRFQLTLWTVLILSAMIVAMFAVPTANVNLDSNLWGVLGISVGSAAGAVIVKGAKAGQTLDDGQTSVLKMPDDGDIPRWRDLFMGEEQSDHKYVDIAKVQMFFFTLIAIIGYGYVLSEWDVLADNAALQNLQQTLYDLLAAGTPTADKLTETNKIVILVAEQFPSSQELQDIKDRLKDPAAAVKKWQTIAPKLAGLIKDIPSANFPPLSQSLLVLIGISHTGYLTVKAANKTPVKG